MFDSFKNCSSNAHHVCCEDGPTKSIYYHLQSDVRYRLRSRSQMRLQLDYSLTLKYIGHYFSYLIDIWHDDRRMDAIYYHTHFMTLTFTQGHSVSANAK